MQASDRGAYLGRVNKKGVEGIWECVPTCDHKHGGQDEALLSAIEDAVEVNSEVYQELLYAVETKCPGETRHETALRYIKEGQNRGSGVAKANNE